MVVTIELISADKIHTIIPLIKLLNPTVAESILSSRLDEMIAQGYRCAGMYAEGSLIGICGMWIMTKFYVGKHIEPDNVFILPEYRHQGLGSRLLEWVYGYGLTQGCIAGELNCYIVNEAGNLFWQREGFAKIGYHYQKKLKD